MKVLKRDGSYQEFNIAKIKLSIASASDELKQPLTLSDLEILSKDIYRELKLLNKDIVTSNEIYGIVYNTLNTSGFNKIAERYEIYAKNLERDNTIF